MKMIEQQTENKVGDVLLKKDFKFNEINQF